MAHARQTVKVTRTTTRTKANSSKGSSPKSGNDSQPRCPSCGKFMNKP